MGCTVTGFHRCRGGRIHAELREPCHSSLVSSRGTSNASFSQTLWRSLLAGGRALVVLVAMLGALPGGAMLLSGQRLGVIYLYCGIPISIVMHHLFRRWFGLVSVSYR